MSVSVLLPVLVCLWLSVTVTLGDYTITIYPEFFKVGHSTHFNRVNFNGKNGLDTPADYSRVKEVGTNAARWIHRDFSGDMFGKATEDSHRKGYPDPAYFLSKQHDISSKYVSNMQGYGNPEMVMEIKDKGH